MSPAYDLVSTALVNPADNEEENFILNARKRKITRNDFVAAFNGAKIDVKVQENIFKKLEKYKSEWMKFIDISFLNFELKSEYKKIISQRIEEFHL